MSARMKKRVRETNAPMSDSFTDPAGDVTNQESGPSPSNVADTISSASAEEVEQERRKRAPSDAPLDAHHSTHNLTDPVGDATNQESGPTPSNVADTANSTSAEEIQQERREGYRQDHRIRRDHFGTVKEVFDLAHAAGFNLTKAELAYCFLFLREQGPTETPPTANDVVTHVTSLRGGLPPVWKYEKASVTSFMRHYRLKYSPFVPRLTKTMGCEIMHADVFAYFWRSLGRLYQPRMTVNAAGLRIGVIQPRSRGVRKVSESLLQPMSELGNITAARKLIVAANAAGDFLPGAIIEQSTHSAPPIRLTSRQLKTPEGIATALKGSKQFSTEEIPEESKVTLADHAAYHDLVKLHQEVEAMLYGFGYNRKIAESLMLEGAKRLLTLGRKSHCVNFPCKAMGPEDPESKRNVAETFELISRDIAADIISIYNRHHHLIPSDGGVTVQKMILKRVVAGVIELLYFELMQVHSVEAEAETVESVWCARRSKPNRVLAAPPSDMTVYFSETGKMGCENMLDYVSHLRKHMDRTISKAPMLLILDWSSYHHDELVLNWCYANRVSLLLVPCGANEKCHPLDVRGMHLIREGLSRRFAKRTLQGCLVPPQDQPLLKREHALACLVHEAVDTMSSIKSRTLCEGFLRALNYFVANPVE